jgi:hypothetical protein
MEPAELLEEAFDAIEGGTFVGKGDRVFVQYRLAEFEWIIRSAMLLVAELAQSEHYVSVESAMARALKRCLARLNDACLGPRTFWWHTSGSGHGVSRWQRQSSTPLSLPPLIRRGSGSSSMVALSQQELLNSDKQEVACTQLSGMSIELGPRGRDQRRWSHGDSAQAGRRDSTSSRASRRYEVLDDDMEAQQDGL